MSKDEAESAAPGRRGWKGAPAEGPSAGRARRGVRRGVRRGLRRGRGAWLLAWPLAYAFEAALLAGVGLVLVVYLAQGRELPLPQTAAAWLESRAGAVLSRPDRPAALSLGRVSLVVEQGGGLRLRAEDVRLGAAQAGQGVSVPALEAVLSPGALLRRGSAPRAVTLEGAALDVTRRADGQLDFGFGTLMLQRRTPAQAIARLRGLFAREAMAPLRSVRLEDLSLTFRDERSGRVWRFEDAALAIERGGGALSVALDADLPGRLSLRLTVPEAGPPTARLSALLDGVPAADLAAQAPALGWLAPLAAPVSGALIGRLTEAGSLGEVDGTLELGPGRFAPRAGQPLPFDRLRAYFAYRPEDARLSFSSLAVEAPALSLAASGHAYLHGPEGGWPTALTAQLALDGGEIGAGAALPGPVALSDGAVDMKIGLEPFAVRIGQAGVTLREGGRLTARGRVAANDGGWAASVDLGLSEATAAQALALWPRTALPGTRDWVARNLRAGRIEGARAGVRIGVDAPPAIAFTFGFRNGEVRALRGLPPIAGARGRAALGEGRFTVSVEEGWITPPEGGALDLAGSAFVIPDTTLQPADGDLRLRAAGPVTAALSLIDQPPLGLLRRAGLGTDLATGRAVLEGRIRFPVGQGVTPEQVGFDVTGTLEDMRSDTLVPGRRLAAERLRLAVDPTELSVAGRAALDGVPLEGRFRQPLGAEAGAGAVTARAALTPEAVATFGLRLPLGTLGGRTEADVSLALARGAAPAFSLVSGLQGLGLRLPGLGWSKPPEAEGRLELAGRLGFEGAPPEFDTLTLEAPGLTARGRVALRPGPALDRLTLDTARLGGWFDGSLALVGRGAGLPPAVELSGGTLDLPRASFGGGGAAHGGGQGVPVRGRLDRLRIAGDVALTGVTADLSPSGGSLSGAFRGQVNGGPVVTGALSPGQGGRPTVRLQTAEAGRALAAAGAFQEARGGFLSLSLTPEAGAGAGAEAGAGAWRGALEVREIRVTAAPGLAALFDTLSVVGLLERLSGPGLLFTEIRAAFRLTPRALQLTSASAVGPSLGISANGIYDMAQRRIDIRGVLSPIYFVNSIGQVFSREGEGLFGFNYRVQGPAGDPAISVNPLSLLTPGAFRQIFRAAPPELPPGAGQ